MHLRRDVPHSSLHKTWTMTMTDDNDTFTLWFEREAQKRREHLARNSKCLSTRTKQLLCQADAENGWMCVSWMAQIANGSAFANRRMPRYVLTTFNWNEMLGKAKKSKPHAVCAVKHTDRVPCTYMLVPMHNEFNFKVVGYSLAQQQTNGRKLEMSTSTHTVAHIRSLSIPPKQPIEWSKIP